LTGISAQTVSADEAGGEQFIKTLLTEDAVSCMRKALSDSASPGAKTSITWSETRNSKGDYKKTFAISGAFFGKDWQLHEESARIDLSAGHGVFSVLTDASMGVFNQKVGAYSVMGLTADHGDDVSKD